MICDSYRGAERPRFRLTSAFLLLACCSVLLTACDWGGSDSEDSASTDAGSGRSGPFTVNYSTPPATLDPTAVVGPDGGFVQSMYVSLVKTGVKPGPGDTIRHDPEAEIEPYLAESWKITEGNKVYTFRLREDARFPSGKPITSDAVKYTFDRNVTMGAIGAYYTNVGQTDPVVRSVTAPNPRTVVIHLSRALPPDLVLRAWSLDALGIVDPEVVEAHGGVEEGELNSWMATHCACSGPYVLESYQPGVRAVFKANPNWFGEPPVEDRLIVNFIESDPTLLLQARSGQADVTIGLSKQSVESLEDDPCCEIIATPESHFTFVALPNQVPPWTNKDLRAALTYAFPYKDALEEVAHGYAQLYYGPLPPTFVGFNEELAEPRPTDLERAQQLMDRSGVEVPIEVDLLTLRGDTNANALATIAQAAWRPLGIEVKIRQLSNAAYTERLFTQKHDYMILRTDGPAVQTPQWLLSYDMACDSQFNSSNICLPEADRLLAQSYETTDEQEQQRLWDQIYQIWNAASPRVSLYANVYTAVLKKGVSEYQYSDMGMLVHTFGY